MTNKCKKCVIKLLGFSLTIIAGVLVGLKVCMAIMLFFAAHELYGFAASLRDYDD